MGKTCFFDEIARCLREEAEKGRHADVPDALLKSFYSEVRNKRPAKARDESPAVKPPEDSKAVAIKPAKGPPAAGSCPQLEEIRAEVASCVKCPLHENRTNTVFGSGPAAAELMFIGEGPGEDEDLQGLPFVGRAGQLLTRMITAMQFDRNDVYIANIVKCRPPGNRNPSEAEAAECIGYLKRQIEIVGPKVIVLLGAVPVRYILKVDGISKVRGRWQDYNGIKVMPTYHPAYLLRNPPAKKDVWEDLKIVMRFFGRQI